MPITKQTIAIVGAEHPIGSKIAKSVCNGNYRLLLFSDDVSAIQPLAEEIVCTGATVDVNVRDCQYDACWEADVIIMAVPYRAYEEVAKIIEQVATQKIVISTANPMRETLDELEALPETNAAQELQKLLPNSKIVKAFHTMTADDFDHSSADSQIDAPIVSNSDKALEVVSELVRAAGFNPVVGGQVEA